MPSRPRIALLEKALMAPDCIPNRAVLQLILVGFASLISPGSLEQITIAVVVSLLFLVLQLQVHCVFRLLTRRRSAVTPRTRRHHRLSRTARLLTTYSPPPPPSVSSCSFSGRLSYDRAHSALRATSSAAGGRLSASCSSRRRRACSDSQDYCSSSNRHADITPRSRRDHAKIARERSARV